MGIQLGGGTPANGGGLNLAKGQKIDLTKGNAGLNKLVVGLGWDVSNSSSAYDLDAEVFLLGENDKLASGKHVVYFNNKVSPDGAVRHAGDNLTGAGEGDDETVQISLNTVSPDIQKIVFAVTIYQAESRRQNFGQVNNAYIRVLDESTNQELCRFDLTEDYSSSVSVVAGQVYRHNGEWKFGAIGDGSAHDLNGLSSHYGLQ